MRFAGEHRAHGFGLQKYELQSLRIGLLVSCWYSVEIFPTGSDFAMVYLSSEVLMVGWKRH